MRGIEFQMQEPKSTEKNKDIPAGVAVYAKHPYVKTVANNGDIYHLAESRKTCYNTAVINAHHSCIFGKVHLETCSRENREATLIAY